MSDPYASRSQQLLMQVVECLAVEPLTPQSRARLAETTGASPDQVYRTLKNLELGGWVCVSSNGWRLSPRITQLAERLRLAIGSIHRTYLEGSHE